VPKIDSSKLNLTKVSAGQFEGLYRNVLNSITNPLFLKNSEHTWILINDAFCELLGMERNDLIGKSDYDYFSEEQADIFWEKDNKVLLTGKPNINEEELTNKEGEKFTILTSKVRIEDEEGRNYILGTITDISQMKFDEIQLEKKNIQINAQKQEIESLVREVHHHTEQSLQIITKVTSLLADKISDTNTSEILTDLNNWIESLTSLHHYLYTSVNVSSINITEYLEELSRDMLEKEKHNIDLSINAKPVLIELKYLMPLGLIINELMLTCRNAFSSMKEKIRVEISLTADHDHLKLQFAAEKPFIDSHEVEKDVNVVDLIGVLVDHMDGTLSLEPSADSLSIYLENIKVSEKSLY
jgi:PAS domain S-box-containing protein